MFLLRAAQEAMGSKLKAVMILSPYIPRLLDGNLLSIIVVWLKSIGFKYISLDIEGYLIGNFNETIAEIDVIQVTPISTAAGARI
ncbi:hypothetical protein D3C74_106700 [compost metagenome]